jgi:putative nucleotidyltransferase with HDIG domain
MQNHIYQNDQSLREFEVIASEIVKEIELLDEDVKFSLFERKANLYEHTLMVTLYSVIVAKKMKITKRDELNNIALGCILHDIGLRYITTNYKNRNLEEVSSYEQFEYKKHTIMGYSAIEQENWIPKISKKIILYHHEQQDGKGFPMRQKNKEREVQIIQVCDMVDRNLCGIECNRISVSEVLKKLKEKSGFIYNNDVVENFVSMIIHESVV